MKHDDDEAPPRAALMGLKQVLRLTGLSKSTFYAGMRSGLYPKGLKLGPRARRWPAQAIWSLIESGVEREDDLPSEQGPARSGLAQTSHRNHPEKGRTR
jgi:predicted DNA-binding transcriptional regulator AlpA